MANTVRDTLTAAIRMVGARALGDTPAEEEMTVALDALQFLLLSLPRTALTEVLISANYTAGENERVTDSSGTAVVSRPTSITDAKTGALRPPRNGAVVEVANATTPTRHIYIAEYKTWMQVNGLVLESTQPFGPEHEQGVRAMTAVRIAADLQVQSVPEWVVALAAMGRQSIRQRFRQPVTVTTDPLLLNVFQRNGANF